MDATRPQWRNQAVQFINTVGIVPKENAVTRLIVAVLLERNDGCAVQKARYMTVESVAPIGTIKLPVLAACLDGSTRQIL